MTQFALAMRAVIYLRYSSDNQRESPLHQLWICKEHLTRGGWTLVQVFRDAAISGATALQPGYQAMLEAARDGISRGPRPSFRGLRWPP
jgi:DNA invertase Pin-like site-specific DNA recombinase